MLSERVLPAERGDYVTVSTTTSNASSHQRHKARVCDSFTKRLQYFVVIALILFAATILLLSINWKAPTSPTPPASPPHEISKCVDQEYIPISDVSDSDNYGASETGTANSSFCTDSLPQFSKCGHHLTDSYVFGKRKKRVIGGDVVCNRNYYPWMAKLLYSPDSGEKTHDCGATVISDRYLLTAAHCVKCRYIEDMEVELRNKVRMEVDKIIDHPGYERNCTEFGGLEANGSRENDIALIRLKERIVNAKPVCLPLIRCYGLDISKVTSPTEKAFVAGHGFTSREANEASKDLHHASLDRYKSAWCKSIYRTGVGESMVNMDTMICAGGQRDVDFCKGDSGGPFFISVNSRSVQIGVASFGSLTCGDGAPAVFTKVLPYMGWIKEETAV